MSAADPLPAAAVAGHLAAVARRRTGRADVAVVLVDGASYTDLDRLIAVARDVPPGGAAHARLAAMRGLVEHECLHLLATDAVAWRSETAALGAAAAERRRALARLRRTMLGRAPELRGRWDVPPALADLDAERRALLAAAHRDLRVRDLANLLEDGRVERWGRAGAPAGVAWLAALELLAPRRPAEPPLRDGLLALVRGDEPVGLAPAVHALAEGALAGTTADAWTAARAIVDRAWAAPPDEPPDLDVALRFAPPEPDLGELRPSLLAAGAGARGGPAEPPDPSRAAAAERALAEARVRVHRLRHDDDAALRGGRAGIDAWAPVAGERRVPVGTLRARMPAAPPPAVGAAADAAAEELRRIVAQRGETRRHVTSGHLDPGSLAGVLTARRTVYARPSRAARRAVALLLLVDLSESTQAERGAMREAVHAVRLACAGADVALAVHGFAGTDAVELLELLPWDEATAGGAGAIDALLDPHVGGGSTPAAEAVGHGRATLAVRPEAVRVLVLLTDGAANGGPERLRDAVAAARGDGLVVVGFHVGHDLEVAATLPRVFGDDQALLADVRRLGPAVLARVADLVAAP